MVRGVERRQMAGAGCGRRQVACGRLVDAWARQVASWRRYRQLADTDAAVTVVRRQMTGARYDREQMACGHCLVRVSVRLTGTQGF